MLYQDLPMHFSLLLVTMRNKLNELCPATKQNQRKRCGETLIYAPAWIRWSF